MNRLHDLQQVLPSVIADSPDEIVVLDYGSTDGLGDYIQGFNHPRIRWVRREADYYHMAHARNLSVLATGYPFVVSSSADIIVKPGFFNEIRRLFCIADMVKASGHDYPGVLAFRKDDFMEAGGYDERFEYYGPEDKELIERLERRGVKASVYDASYLDQVKTTNKAGNYRTHSRVKMYVETKKIHQENTKREVLTVNENGWGR